MIDISFFAATNDPGIKSIDLHSVGYISDALELLERDLARAYITERYCRVIYGVGTGALMRAVFQRLKEMPQVKNFVEETSGGSCVVFFA